METMTCVGEIPGVHCVTGYCWTFSNKLSWTAETSTWQYRDLLETCHSRGFSCCSTRLNGFKKFVSETQSWLLWRALVCLCVFYLRLNWNIAIKNWNLKQLFWMLILFNNQKAYFRRTAILRVDARYDMSVPQRRRQTAFFKRHALITKQNNYINWYKSISFVFVKRI